MKKGWILTQESFDDLLAWLSPDREEAGRRYEEIRNGLIKIFYYRGCPDPESLADETINRVIKKIADLKTGYEGDQVKYFYAVANKIYLESLSPKQTRLKQLDQEAGLDRNDSFAASKTDYEAEADDARHNCLEKCLARFSSPDRELILAYYGLERSAKIEHRRLLAEKAGLSCATLRVKVHRLKNALEICVRKCIAETNK